MQEAIKFFKESAYKKAEKLFEKLKSQASDDKELCQILEYLIQIKLKLKKMSCSELEDELIQVYFRIGEYEKIIERIETCTSIQSQFCAIQSLYNLGNISKFQERSKKICEKIISEKIYNEVEVVISWIEKRLKNELYPYFAKLIYYIEIEDASNALTYVDEIENLVINKWKQLEKSNKTKLEHLIALRELLGELSIPSFEVKKKKLELRLKTRAMGEEKPLRPSEILEMIIVFSESAEYLTLLLCSIEDQFLKLDLKEYIVGIPKVNYKLVEKYSPLAKSYLHLKTEVRVNYVRENVDVQPLFQIEAYADITEGEREKIYAYYLSDNKNKKIEDEINYLIKYDEEVNKEPMSLIITLINLELYDSAFKLLERETESLTKTYLKAQIHFLKKEFSKVIESINEVRKIEDKFEEIPFLYLKAEAYKKLDKPSEAQNLYALIATLDPNFRSLKERLA